jgi:hypothetical protein
VGKSVKVRRHSSLGHLSPVVFEQVRGEPEGFYGDPSKRGIRKNKLDRNRTSEEKGRVLYCNCEGGELKE